MTRKRHSIYAALRLRYERRSRLERLPLGDDVPACVRVAAEIARRGDLINIHDPTVSLPGVALPDDVGFAVAVEVTCAFDVPLGRDVVADMTLCGDRGAIYEIFVPLSVLVLPKNVGLAVAVEVARAGDDVPGCHIIGPDQPAARH